MGMSIHCPTRARVIEAHPPIVPLALGRKVDFLAGELERPAARSDPAPTEYLLMAQSGHGDRVHECPLLG